MTAVQMPRRWRGKTGMPPRRSQDAMQRSIVAGRRLALLRERRGLSRQKLADQITEAGYRISLTTITHMENGHPIAGPRSMTVDDLWALSSFFAVSMETFLRDPECSTCLDLPPAGFRCVTCDREGQIA